MVSVKQNHSRAALVGQLLRWKGEHIYYTTVLPPVLWNSERVRWSMQKWPILLLLSKSCHFLRSGRSSANTALGNYVLILPRSAWLELLLPSWFSLWVQQAQLCYGMSSVHGSSCPCAPCQTQQHSFAHSEAHRLSATGTTESHGMEDTTVPCLCSVPHSFTYNTNRKKINDDKRVKSVLNTIYL